MADQNLIPLFPNQADIKQYVPSIHLNMSGKTIGPYINQAIKFDLVPYIGNLFWQEINNDIDNVLYADLLPYLRSTVAWFAYKRMIGNSRAALGDMGLQQKSDTEGTLLPATDKQYTDLLWNAYRTAFDELECLLWQYLCPNKATFPTFEASTEAALCCKYVLTSPAIYAQYAPIKKEGRLEDWLAFIPIMNEIELYCIKPILCTELYNELKEQLCADTLTPANKALLTHVRFATGAMIRQYWAGKNAVKLQARSNFIPEYSDSTGSRKTPTYNALEHQYRYEIITEHAAIKVLLETLKNNEDDYPLWRDSTCNPSYCPPVTEEETTTDCCQTCDCSPCCCYTYKRKSILVF